MADEDFEIEYLDEDEDLVQQCVQTGDMSAPVALSTVAAAPKFVEKLKAPETDTSSLLVERTPVGRSVGKRKKKREEDDSDYNPNQSDEDYEPEPEPKRPYKKKQMPTPRPVSTDLKKYRHNTMSKKEEIKFRRDLGVQIPNFEDPLCLPVKAIITDEYDMIKLKNWNNLCLKKFKDNDTVLKDDIGETVSSQRSVVLKNVKNKLTGKNETTMWSKVSVHSVSDKKAELIQCVLPKFREPKVLSFPATPHPKKMKPPHTTETVVISKEEDKAEVMVVYKPQHALSAVYKLVESPEVEDPTKKDEEKKQYLQELTVCKICAPCYQGSWRGFRRTTKKKSVVCPICVRTFVSVYNLLAHVKTHSAADVQKNKKVLGKALATVVDYHYRCRICQQKCVSIKELRKHVLTHQSTEQFQCEVCNRVIKNASSV